MNHSLRTPRHDRGLTLVEVLAAVGLFGVISAIAVSNFRASVPSFRARGAALLVAGDMNQARMGAVKEGLRFYFVPGEGTTYQIQRDDPDGGGPITLKTVDVDREYPGVVFSNEGVTEDPYGGDLAGVGAVPEGPVTFHSDGTVQNPAGVFVQAQSPDGHVHHAITVTVAGRIRVWRHDGAEWS